MLGARPANERTGPVDECCIRKCRLSGRLEDSSGGGIAAFFRNLFSDNATDDDHAYYSEAKRSGRYAMVVQAPPEMTDRAGDILNSSGAIEVETESDGPRGQYTTGETASQVCGSGDQAMIPVV